MHNFRCEVNLSGFPNLLLQSLFFGPEVLLESKNLLIIQFVEVAVLVSGVPFNSVAFFVFISFRAVMDMFVLNIFNILLLVAMMMIVVIVVNVEGIL